MSVASLLAAADTVPAPDVEWSALSPFLVVVVGACLLLPIAGLLPRRTRVAWSALFTIAVTLGAIGASAWVWHDLSRVGPTERTTVAGAYAVDKFSLFLIVVICVGVILATLLTEGYLRREDLPGAEAYLLYLASASGAIIMVTAADLIVLFIGLEVLSIAAYVLAGLHRRRLRSGEAALKYFVLGGFSSAFFLYGVALIYGATGTTNLVGIAEYLATHRLLDEGLLLAGIGLLIVGFAFKVGGVPFHVWTPDVYQGSPSPVVAFMASVVKAAAFAGMLRVVVVALSTHRLDWQPILYAIAVLSMIVGAVLAVVQSDVKRMLAYSSINHAGFMLAAVSTGADEGIAAVLFYLAAYTVLIGGTFGIVTLFGRRGDGHHDIDDYRGLARREPFLALALTIFLLAQAGTPLTAGFLAKFYVIQAVVDAGSWWLGLVAMLAATISAFLYLRIVLTMYAGVTDADVEVAEPTAEPVRRIHVPLGAKVAIAAALVLTIAIGVVPDPLTHASRTARPELVAPGD